MAALLALASAVSFGVADFLGGLATRRAAVLPVTTLSQLTGAAMLVVAVPLGGGSVSAQALGWGAAAGLGGAGGLVCYLRALAIGPMGVTAPVAAIVGSALPVAVGILVAGERPPVLAVVGIVVGVLATTLVSRPAPDPARLAEADALRRGLAWALAAGALFGLFFVGLDAADADSGLWPLVGARASGLTLLGALLVVQRPAAPGGWAGGVALMSGGLDMLANVLFLLATQQGLLVLVAVLTSLYPVVVVLLARQVLGERLGRHQWTGVALAFVAVVLIAL